MSQRAVEVLIGRLATDEGLRARFARDPDAVLDEAASCGLELSRLEREALRALDVSACDHFADAVDPRLQKACLRKDRP